jgi:hypothetical protein
MARYEEKLAQECVEWVENRIKEIENKKTK